MTTSFGYKDTELTGVSAPEVPVTNLNYTADYRVVRSGNGECILTNIQTPIDQPETIRVAYKKVNDVFAGSNLNKLQAAAIDKTGVQILVQDCASLKQTNADGSSVTVPVSLHLVAKIPTGIEIDQSIITGQLSRLLGVLYEDGGSRVSSLVKGAIIPKNL